MFSSVFNKVRSFVSSPRQASDNKDKSRKRPLERDDIEIREVAQTTTKRRRQDIPAGLEKAATHTNKRSFPTFSKLAEWIVKKKGDFTDQYIVRSKIDPGKKSSQRGDRRPVTQYATEGSYRQPGPSAGQQWKPEQHTSHGSQQRYSNISVVRPDPSQSMSHYSANKPVAYPTNSPISKSSLCGAFVKEKVAGSDAFARKHQPNQPWSRTHGHQPVTHKGIYNAHANETPMSVYERTFSNAGKNMTKSRSGSSLRHKFTAETNIDFDEKVRYGALLQQFTSVPLDNSKTEHIATNPAYNQAALHVTSTRLLKESSLLGSALPDSAAFVGRTPRPVSPIPFVRPYVTRHVTTKSVVGSSKRKQFDQDVICVDDQRSVYFSRHPVLDSKSILHKSQSLPSCEVICEDHVTRSGVSFSPYKGYKKKPVEYDLTASEPILNIIPGHVETASAGKSTKSVPQRSASVEELSDGSVIIVEEKLAKNILSPLQESIKQSPYYNDDFIKNIQEEYVKAAEIRQRDIIRAKAETEFLREKRAERDAHFEAEVRLRLRLTDSSPVLEEIVISSSEEEDDLEIIEDDDEDEFPDLGEDIENQIDLAQVPTPTGEVLVTAFRIPITRGDMNTLAGLNWLNDEIINYYMSLLIERGQKDGYFKVHAFNTFFLQKLASQGYNGVKRWTKKVDIFDHDYVLVPVHLGMHWCMAIVDFVQKKVRYFDSMGGRNDRCLSAMRNYVNEEHKSRKNSEFDFTGWSFLHEKDIPQQMNGSDCGMFACKYAEYATRNCPITFTQAHIPYFRRRMVYEILSQKLL